VVAGDGRGRSLLGVPTANLALPGGLALPADGVYAGHLAEEPGGSARPAAISVGTNPQFGTERRVEAHVLDFDGDLYGRAVAVDFRQRVRGQAVFPTVEELIAQMRRDLDEARRLLASPPGGKVPSGGFPRPTP
jgi:riboflavin kinase/FMN adenylyltransferase